MSVPATADDSEVLYEVPVYDVPPIKDFSNIPNVIERTVYPDD